MASAFTHAFLAVVIGKVVKGREKMPLRFWFGLAACSALPDLDVIGMGLGVPYSSPFGHRGFTHSLIFAVFLAWIVLELMVLEASRFSKEWWILWTCLFFSTASHGFLDAFTNGGLGVAFFWSFEDTRYFFPWRPILVSPLSVHRFFDARGLNILWSEFLWIWFPMIVLYLLSGSWRKRK